MSILGHTQVQLDDLVQVSLLFSAIVFVSSTIQGAALEGNELSKLNLVRRYQVRTELFYSIVWY